MDYVGIDMHKKESQICIVAEGGALVECRVRTEAGGFADVFERSVTREAVSFSRQEGRPAAR